MSMPPTPEQSYKVICISIYKTDLDALDTSVQTLKAKGHTKVSRSALIRYALAQLDINTVPKDIK